MMRISILLFSLCTVFSAEPLRLSEIVPGAARMEMYNTNWDDKRGRHKILNADKEINLKSQPINKVVLSEADAIAVITAVRTKDPNGIGALCFVPHHGFIIYASNNEIIDSIDICFMCGKAASTLPDTFMLCDLKAIAQIVTKNGLPTRNPDW